jgi:hypothetical protein
VRCLSSWLISLRGVSRLQVMHVITAHSVLYDNISLYLFLTNRNFCVIEIDVRLLSIAVSPLEAAIHKTSHHQIDDQLTI